MSSALSAPPSLDGPLLSALVRGLQDYAVLLLDRDGRIVSWNAGEADFKGWRQEEILGADHGILYPADDREANRPREDLQAAAQYGRVEERGWRERRDGSRFWANVVITPVRDGAGELAGFGEVVRDATDHLAAITALRSSEARFRALTESATEAILSIDGRGRIATWNPAASRLYGLEAAEAIGSSVMRLIPDSLRAGAERLLAGGRTPSGVYEGLALRADGGEFPVEISLGGWESDGERHLSAIVRDITERRETERALKHLADHDPLTGLPNRRRFERDLERVVGESERYGRPAALLVLDLDGFKQVNDRHGHSAGDEVIVKVGALLRERVRDSDVVARLGGDEFGIIVQEADRAQAVLVAEKIVESMRGQGVVIGELVRAHVTASVGITLITPAAGASAEELLVQADGAMYEAKTRGRNRWTVHHADVAGPGAWPERRSWLQHLREALAHDAFELHAQPIVPIGPAALPRFELLLRLPGPDGRLAAPSAFLDNAERYDLIGNIDRWVLRRAVGLLHAHHVAGQEISLTVNISGKTMNDDGIAEDLRAMLRASPVPAGRLIVEVTETAAIVNIARAAELAGELRELGCDFALDDFGSGFASFHYLKHLSFDYLKIDGEFIAGLVGTPGDQLVVRAVVDIARGLGSETIAEFVEDGATLELLQELGVDHCQGFHLGRPEPIARRLPSLRAA